MSQLIDSLGRPIRYLRVSVTDRCNLRCRYCVPSSEFVPLSHGQIISYEEIQRLVRILAPGGVSSIRITGGEPLVRKHLDRLVRGLSRIPGIRDISLTTNGFLLTDFAGTLKKAGLYRVNISLDTLREDRFTWITGPEGKRNPGGIDRVLSGIDEARRTGLSPLKINVVLIRGFNDDELVDFASMTRDQPYEVRFIEFMPMSAEGFWGPEKVVPAAEAIGRLETVHGSLTHLGRCEGSGPAICYQVPGYKGTLGFITPVSQHFCVECNRIRITSDGKLRTCLFSDREQDILGPMRSGASDVEILRIIQDALAEKPEGHGMGKEEGKVPECARTMSHIGG
ncbi:MAG: GTP 3',8-cyclase MoaA [Pseudomonadota bacterium]